MVFANLKSHIDGLAGGGSLSLWNGYPQYYVSPFVCNCMFIFNFDARDFLFFLNRAIHTSANQL